MFTPSKQANNGLVDFESFYQHFRPSAQISPVEVNTPSQYTERPVSVEYAQTELSRGIVETAEALGVDPLDVATAVSYETAGTFDPRKKGPTTQWGQHEGLLQFGQPQQKQYGVDLSSHGNALNSQLGAEGAIVKYLRNAGVEEGMGLLDIYSAINAGHVGLYDRTDENNGGASGTVKEKVENQMAGHRRNAMRILGLEG